MPSFFRRLTPLMTCVLLASSARAATPEDARGRWLTSEQDGVIDFQPCEGKAGTLCGHIVWDKDAGGPKDNCGLQVAQFNRFDGEAWRDGWVYDPRDNKKYKGALRIKGATLHLRAFVGSEVLGQTEQMTRVEILPASPSCAKP